MNFWPFARRLPATVDEAVDYLLAGLDDESKATLRSLKRDDLAAELHFSWGLGIRNELGLWGKNKALIRDCGTDDADEASSRIMEAVWDRLAEATSN